MNPTPATERRRHQRFELHLPVTVVGDHGRAALRDISEGGLFIETSEPLPLGDALPLRLVHPESGDELAVRCQVVRHVHDQHGALLGLGLRFVDLDATMNQRILALIADLTGLAGDDEGAPADSDQADDDDDAAVFELEEAPWPDEADDGERPEVDVLVLGGELAEADEPAAADQEPATGAVPEVPIIWPDSQPRKAEGRRPALNPMQLRLLAFVDGNNSVAQIARGAGIDLELALQELSELAHDGVLHIPEQPTDDDEIDAWAAGIDTGAAALFPGREAEREQRELWRKAHALVAQGLAAERNNDFAEAAGLLEAALDLDPPNRGNIHARLAVLALEHLHDPVRAEKHARAVIEAEPHRPYGERLMRQIRARKARRVKLRRAPKQSRRRRVITKPRLLHKGRAPRRTSLRPLVGAIATLAVVALAAWNLNTFLLAPRRQAPKELSPAAISDLVPARQVLLQDRRLVVTIATGWTTLSPTERREKVERLARWAKDNHQVEEVLVADPSPRLLARARDGVVTLFGPGENRAARP